jgi:hypothetical protein
MSRVQSYACAACEQIFGSKWALDDHAKNCPVRRNAELARIQEALEWKQSRIESSVGICYRYAARGFLEYNANQNKLAQRLLAKETRSHRIAVDFGGGLIAQVSTELINHFVRLAGEWSHDGWTAKNVDLLQGAPHLIFGSAMYFDDMLLRKNGKPPSMPREVFTESRRGLAAA